MARILYDTTTSALVSYPRDDDNPVIGLDPRYLEMALIQEPQPIYDSGAEQIVPTEAIDTDALVVTRGWNVLPLPPPAPVPDWTTFKNTALNSSSLNLVLTAAYGVVPVAAGALAPALLAAEQGRVSDFASSWSAICAAVSVDPQVIAGFTDVASSCNLPLDFIEALNPSNSSSAAT
jgi:hypothetical protein